MLFSLWSRWTDESNLQVTAESTSSKEAEVLSKEPRGNDGFFEDVFSWRIFVKIPDAPICMVYFMPTFTNPKLHKFVDNICHISFIVEHQGRCVSFFFWFDPCVEITILVGRYVYNLLLASQRNPSFWETTLCSSLLFSMNVTHAVYIYIYIYVFFFSMSIYIPPQDTNITIQHQKVVIFFLKIKIY